MPEKTYDVPSPLGMVIKRLRYFLEEWYRLPGLLD